MKNRFKPFLKKRPQRVLPGAAIGSKTTFNLSFVESDEVNFVINDELCRDS